MKCEIEKKLNEMSLHGAKYSQLDQKENGHQMALRNTRLHSKTIISVLFHSECHSKRGKWLNDTGNCRQIYLEISRSFFKCIIKYTFYSKIEVQLWHFTDSECSGKGYIIYTGRII